MMSLKVSLIACDSTVSFLNTVSLLSFEIITASTYDGALYSSGVISAL